MLSTLLLGLIPVHMLFINNIKEVFLKEYIHACLFIGLILCTIHLLFHYIFSASTATILTLIFASFLYTYKKFALIIFTPFQLTRKHIANSLRLIHSVFLVLLLLTVFNILNHINLTVINNIILYTGIILTILIQVALIDKYKKQQIEKNNSIEKLKKHININQIGNISSNKYPDIYHIILDAHPGFHDKNFYDEQFKQDLEKRNFRIYADHYSNYDYTTQSIPSLLQMKYFPTTDEVDDIDTLNDSLHWSLLNNKLFDYLLNKSYHLNLIYSKFSFGSINMKITNNINIFCYNENQNSSNKIINMIKFYCGLKFKTAFYFINSPKEILYQFNKIAETKNNNNPTYTFAHILAPHAPNWFNENGKPNKKGLANSFDYVKFCNKKIINTVDKILEQNKDAIFIIHSDHGLTENSHRYQILSAIRIPEQFNKINIPNKLTLVNLFRYLFNELFNDTLEILPDKFYHMEYPNSRALKQIENQFIENNTPFYK